MEYRTPAIHEQNISILHLVRRPPADRLLRRQLRRCLVVKRDHRPYGIDFIAPPCVRNNSVTEILYFFVAEYTPGMKIGEGGGLDHENEDIEVLELPFTQALEMMNTGEIRDGKTMLLLQYAQLNHLLGEAFIYT